MPIQGALKADQLIVAQLTVDLTRSPVRIDVLAAMVDNDTGNTIAWIPCRGNLWSTETQGALRALLDSMERDISRSVLQPTAAGARDTRSAAVPVGGIGEHVGEGEDAEAPSF